MNNSFSRYNTYPINRAHSSRRLSNSLSSNWITVREGRDGNTGREGERTYTQAAEQAAELRTEASQPATATEIHAATDMAAAHPAAPDVHAAADTAEVTNPFSKKASSAIETPASSQVREYAQPEPGLSAYGCVFHKGPQRLIVVRSGEAVPVCFNAHSCLNRIAYNEGDNYVAAAEAGDYEITFDLRVSAKASAPVIFELRAGNKPLPGGTFEYALSSGTRECRGATMARLQSGDHISLVMTSVSVCEASLASGGVSAMLMLKKLD